MKRSTFSTILVFFIFVLAVLTSIIFVINFKSIAGPQDITLKELNQTEALYSNENIPFPQEEYHSNIKETVDYEKAGLNFYIIVGSFSNLPLAQQAAEKITKDSNKNIIVLPQTKEGIYRISCGKYTTKVEADSAIQDVRSKIKSDAWILKPVN